MSSNKWEMVIDAANGVISRTSLNGIYRHDIGSLCDGYKIVKVDGKRVKAHRLIWNYVNGTIPDGYEIDHINGVRCDNRISNLRLVTRSQNCENRQTAHVTNKTSGIKGVTFHKHRMKWQAQIGHLRKNHYLGSFSNLIDAVSAYNKAVSEIHTHNPSRGEK